MALANVDYWRTFRDFDSNKNIIANQAQDIITFKGGDNITLDFNTGTDVITWNVNLNGAAQQVQSNLSVVNSNVNLNPSMLDYDSATGVFTYFPPDMSDYATIEYVNDTVASDIANIDLTAYATEVWVQGYVGTAVNVPDVDNLVTKTEYNQDYVNINVKLDQISANAVGYTGSSGQDGSSVKIVGSVANYAVLTTLPRWTNYLGQKGDGVILEDSGHLAVATFITPFPSVWEDVGPIIGYTGSASTVQGPIGYTGSSVIVGFFVHEQNVASNFWTVSHNLGVQYLSAEVINDVDNSLVGTYSYPTITFVDENTTTVEWTVPTTGKLVLSAGGVSPELIGYTGSKGDPADVNTVYTYNTLPLHQKGLRAFISDSILDAAGNFGEITGAGSTLKFAPVYSDGVNWRIG